MWSINVHINNKQRKKCQKPCRIVNKYHISKTHIICYFLVDKLNTLKEKKIDILISWKMAGNNLLCNIFSDFVFLWNYYEGFQIYFNNQKLPRMML